MSVIHKWYDDNAASFANAAVIELPFIGLPAAVQERLNRFKLWAVDCGEHVSLDGKKVLEFGAGHGRLPLTYPQIGSYTGVDYSQNLVELGNQRLAAAGAQHRARLVHSDTLSYRDSATDYDVVCSLGMMCYFEDATAPVRKMVSHLRPGGTVFFDFRVDSPVYSTIRRIKWALKPPTGGITYMLTPGQAVKILKDMGMTDIRLVSREFPFLASIYAGGDSSWPLRLRNKMARSDMLRNFATEAWVFARKPA